MDFPKNLSYLRPMNFKSGFYIICILCGILFQDCSCTDDEVIPYVQFDSEFLNFVDYKTGSYWIYTELNSGKTDSSYVRYNTKSTLLSSTLPSKIVNTDLLSMEIVMRDTSWKGQSVVYDDNGTYRFSYYLSDSITGVNNETYDDVPLMKNAPPVSHGDFSSIKYLSSFKIQGIQYNNVKVFKSTSNTYFKSIYWVENIGIIKKDLKDGTKWELLRSGISN